MEWLRISTSTELVRVATDEIVYVRADGNYSDLVLTNGKSRKMTFQLHFFDEVFQQLQNNMFVRVGRSLIVNKRYIYVINLTEQQLILSGGELKEPTVFYGQPKAESPQNITLAREGLKQLKELLENEKGNDNG
jgi:DNA-binding LytR/AlgR family response regulator